MNNKAMMQTRSARTTGPWLNIPLALAENLIRAGYIVRVKQSGSGKAGRPPTTDTPPTERK